MAKPFTSKRVVGNSWGQSGLGTCGMGEREIVAMIPAVYDKLHKNKWGKSV